jgi:hypothetical protein
MKYRFLQKADVLSWKHSGACWQWRKPVLGALLMQTNFSRLSTPPPGDRVPLIQGMTTLAHDLQSVIRQHFVEGEKRARITKMEILGVLIEHYEAEHVPELTDEE